MNSLKSLILVAALTLVSCIGEVNSDTTPRKVKSERAVLSADNLERATFPGKVVAASDVNIGFRVAGIVDQICVADGEYVEEGDVVARLDPRDYALQLEATQAEYDAVKAEVDRVVALYADQSVSANDYDKATLTLRAITAKLTAHKNALADTELRAPMSGYVNKSNFDKGEAVAAGTPVLSIISDSAPEITINIPAAYYIQQSQYESATAQIDLYVGREFGLKLKSTSPKANLNQLYRVTFTVENSEGFYPSVGMSAMVEMCYLKDALRSVDIPLSAIVERGGESSVWVVKDGVVESRGVKVGEIKSCGVARIVSGVEAGEDVVVAGVNSLKEGQRVSILEPESKSNIGGVK